MAEKSNPPGLRLSTLTQPGGALAPFRSTTFRAIWIANLASNMGAMIQTVAAAWLMTEMTDSHVLVGLVQASAMIPIMFFGPIAGAIADNFDRRRVMLAAQLGMLGVSTLLAMLAYFGTIGPALLLAMTLLVGIGTALNAPAWQASVRQQVGRADLSQAVSLNTISMNLARSVGPAVGGLLIAVWGTALAFGVNASSYLAMIAVLVLWHPRTPAPPRQPILTALKVGVRHCAGSLPMRRLLIRGSALGFGFGAYNGLLPAVARDQIGTSETGFGLLLGAFGVGSIASALIVTALRRRFGFDALFSAGAIIFAVGASAIAQVTDLQAGLAAALFAGMAWVFSLTSLNVAVQLMAPEAILGRCLSIYQSVTFGSMAVGAWAWGALADESGLPFALHASSAWLVVSLVLARLAAPLTWPDALVAPERPEPA